MKRKSPLVTADRQIASLPARLRRHLHESADGLSLIIENTTIGDLDIDAGELSYIGIGASSLSNVSIRNLDGNLHISGVMGRMVSRNLLICDSRIGTFMTPQAHYSSCHLVNTDIDELGAATSTFRDCAFKGRIATGVFMLPETRPERPADDEGFEGNDFSACDLGDVDFRGGIDLARQTFSKEQLALVIQDAPAMLDHLDGYAGPYFTTPGLIRIRDLIRRYVQEMRQQHIFVSRPLVKSFLARYLADFERDWGVVSPEFQAWAEKVCSINRTP